MKKQKYLWLVFHIRWHIINNTTAHLVCDTVDKVYSVNGAQTNYYQLYNMDDNFVKVLRDVFNISRLNINAIYNLDPAELQAFAENHYADQAENLHQTISWIRNEP